MNKLKMLLLTALVAATVGTGALAAAPSASAKPTDNCAKIREKAIIYQDVYDLLNATGYRRTIAAAQAGARAEAMREAYFACAGW
jgi:hypothetical protein